MVIHLDQVNQYHELPNGKFRRLTVDDEYIHRSQRRHFIPFDVLPLVGTCLASGLLFFHPIGYVEIGLFAVMWLLTGLGITAGYHRLFAHRSYKTVPAVRVLLTILGSMSARGSMISWAAMHRRQHLHVAERIETLCSRVASMRECAVLGFPLRRGDGRRVGHVTLQ